MSVGRLVLKGNAGLYQVLNSTNVATQLINADDGSWVGPVGPSTVEPGDITLAGLSVPGRSAATAGAGGNLTGTADQVLRVNTAGTALGFGTIAAGGIASNAVTTAKIADANVTLGKLASGITPSHVVKFAGQPTTVGGAAAEAFTVTGVAATDLAFVQIVSDGTANVTVLQAVCTLNTLTVTFSANPGNDTVFNYQILRAAA